MKTMDKTGLIDSILTTSDKLFRILLPTIPKELLTLDVTMPQMKIMLMLFIKGPMRMSNIAAELDVTLPTATSFIDRLVEKDFVIRVSHPNDRRVVLCRLTETGQKTLDVIWKSSEGNLSRILQEMDLKQLQMLMEVLEYMLETARTKSEPNLIGDTIKKEIQAI